MKKIVFFSLIIFSLIINKSFALEKKQITGDELSLKLDTLNWYNLENSKEHKVLIEKAKAEIQVYDNEYYLKGYKDINQFYWWRFGENANQEAVLMLLGEGYVFYINYYDEGYVKLDDWKNVNSSDLLKDLEESAKEGKQFYVERNLPFATKFQWIFDPYLNTENRSVSYSYKVFWSNGDESMETKNIILGKKGYFDTAYVVNTKNKNVDFKEEASYAKDFVNGVVFNDGFQHSDFKPGDKIAAVGVGSLVAGSLGAKVIAKTGFLAKFLPLLAKFWWILLAPIAAFSFSKREKNTSRSSKRKKK